MKLARPLTPPLLALLAHLTHHPLQAQDIPQLILLLMPRSIPPLGQTMAMSNMRSGILSGPVRIGALALRRGFSPSDATLLPPGGENSSSWFRSTALDCTSVVECPPPGENPPPGESPFGVVRLRREALGRTTGASGAKQGPRPPETQKPRSRPRNPGPRNPDSGMPVNPKSLARNNLDELRTITLKSTPHSPPAAGPASGATGPPGTPSLAEGIPPNYTFTDEEWKAMSSYQRRRWNKIKKNRFAAK